MNNINTQNIIILRFLSIPSRHQPFNNFVHQLLRIRGGKNEENSSFELQHTSKLIQYSTRPIGKILGDFHVSLNLLSYYVKQVTVEIDERLIMKCETLKEQRKVSLHESHISQPRKCLCPFSGWQEFAAKFDTVSCSLLPAAYFNLGHYSHGGVLLEEFVGTADKLPATSPYL
jgi:hypothetical protein